VYDSDDRADLCSDDDSINELRRTVGEKLRPGLSVSRRWHGEISFADGFTRPGFYQWARRGISGAGCPASYVKYSEDGDHNTVTALDWMTFVLHRLVEIERRDPSPAVASYGTD